MTTQRDDTGEASVLDVLLVDDNAELRRILARGLTARGFRVIAVGSADEALLAAADLEQPIDVIVMDLMLPDSWGSQVAMEQKLFRPDVPIVYISGYARDDAVLEASLTSGEVPFLSKPFTIDELVAAIHATTEA